MISFSGIDCGGKSTQIEKIAEYMRNELGYGKRVKIIHSRGGYTPMLEFMKSIIRRDKNSSREEQDRYREEIHSSKRKRKLLLWLSIFDLALYYGIYFRLLELFGKKILADRYFWDSYIDFLMKYPEFDFERWLVFRFAKGIYKKPRHSVIYVIDAELSMYRSTLKDEPWPEPVEVRRERINIYLSQIEKGRWMHVIDARDDIESVFQKTKEIIFN
ncbi:MAG: hypothetical protein E7676_05025 [Ruminococcaceae bacterium]|nr:hypothetical protein [Oscillospiraceae bacterium]